MVVWEVFGRGAFGVADVPELDAATSSAREPGDGDEVALEAAVDVRLGAVDFTLVGLGCAGRRGIGSLADWAE